MLGAPASELPEFPAALAFLPVLSRGEALRQLELRIVAIEAELARARNAVRDALAHRLPRLFLIEDDYKQSMPKAELVWTKKLAGELRSKRLTWSPRWLRRIAAEFEDPDRGSQPAWRISFKARSGTHRCRR